MWGLPSKNLAIDLGNNNTLLIDQSSILLSQPSFMVINEDNNKVEAVGDRAYQMLKKTHLHLNPLSHVSKGIGQILSSPQKYKAVLL
jgi:rod shape-determining protein MreB